LARTWLLYGGDSPLLSHRGHTVKNVLAIFYKIAIDNSKEFCYGLHVVTEDPDTTLGSEMENDTTATTNAITTRTKSEALAEELRKKILTEYAPGQLFPTEATMAAQAGVSVWTVRRALQRLADEGLIVRRQGRRVAAESAVRHRVSRSPTATKTVLLLPRGPAHFFHQETVEIQKALSRLGYNTACCEMPLDAVDCPAEIEKALRSHRADAAVVGPITRFYDLFRAPFDQVGMPVVFLRPHEHVPANYVAVDLGTGVYFALCHLRDIGCRNIRFFGAMCSDLIWERDEGVRRFVSEFYRGRSVEEYVVHAEGDLESGYAAASAEFKAGRIPDGILAQNDYCAMGIMMAARERGIRIPQDMAIIGIDDIPGARKTVPPLTTLRQPIESVAREVARIVHQCLSDPSQRMRDSFVLTPPLVLRASTIRYAALREAAALTKGGAA